MDPRLDAMGLVQVEPWRFVRVRGILTLARWSPRPSQKACTHTALTTHEAGSLARYFRLNLPTLPELGRDSVVPWTGPIGKALEEARSYSKDRPKEPHHAR